MPMKLRDILKTPDDFRVKQEAAFLAALGLAKSTGALFADSGTTVSVSPKKIVISWGAGLGQWLLNKKGRK